LQFLALVNRARMECGVSAIPLSSFSGLAAADLRIKTWVAQAWADVQAMHSDWQFMQTPVSFATVDNQSLYLPTDTGVGTDVTDWKRDSFRCYSTADGYGDEQVLPYMEQDTFRDVYQFGQMRTNQSRPVVFAIDPATRGLLIGPVPLAGYTIDGLCYRMPTDLVSETDDPGGTGNNLPSRWHMLLVWKAAQSYAFYEAAPEVKQRADTEVTRLKEELEIEQIPSMIFGPPLG